MTETKAQTGEGKEVMGIPAIATILVSSVAGFAFVSYMLEAGISQLKKTNPDLATFSKSPLLCSHPFVFTK